MCGQLKLSKRFIKAPRCEIQGLRLLSQLQDLPSTAGASELLISPRAYLGPGDGLEHVGKLARNKSSFKEERWEYNK
jgi:hypothetical protein